MCSSVLLLSVIPTNPCSISIFAVISQSVIISHASVSEQLNYLSLPYHCMLACTVPSTASCFFRLFFHPYSGEKPGLDAPTHVHPYLSFVRYIGMVIFYFDNRVKISPCCYYSLRPRDRCACESVGTASFAVNRLFLLLIMAASCANVTPYYSCSQSSLLVRNDCCQMSL